MGALSGEGLHELKLSTSHGFGLREMDLRTFMRLGAEVLKG